ncbi:type I phosphomannose isomerase catalytic subunit [uncultured Tenacibaculum sp.]|uniref:type I phosphomannose isomerase catalytic subunit n=1 Tax=uncultured Tenacibaculum sp. TaxID=174713 RepID=UPI0026072386|nr:type I phosphomannose isomerase catalytic subunit [uncultured Tenacibaculum sp.]
MIDLLLRFEPILKEKIWGGQKLIQLFGKSSSKENIGESWEISDVNGDETVVSKGSLKGKSLKDLTKLYTTDFLGNKVYQKFGNQFPLLIKFIDAKEKLSIQLHPDDELAKKRHDSFGKTEMWYIMQADKDSKIMVGFKEDSNEKEYLQHVKNKTLLDLLNIDNVLSGDVYFIPTGRIHAVGAGVVLAEIQQTSDNTYRVYDWDRQDIDGNYRELHTELTKEAIDYKALKDYKTLYKVKEGGTSEMVSCPHFTTNLISFEGKLDVNHKDKDSFVIYMCVNGEVDFNYKNQTENVKVGETIMLPACVKEVSLSSTLNSKLLEVYIK